MQNLRILACVVAALGSLTAAGCGSDNDCDSDNIDNIDCTCVDNNHNNKCTAGVIRVENQSGFAIKEVHFTAVGSTVWGANLITGPLASGTTITVATQCGQFDVLLVDAAGQQCILHNVDTCQNNADWIIANNVCSTFTNTDP